jgi:hypothetical protein
MFLTDIKGGFGSNPAFAIEVGDFQFRMMDRGASARGDKGVKVVVGTYKELQRGAVNAAQPVNARISTVVFIVADAPGKGPTPVWQQLHETHFPVPASGTL